MLVEVKINEGQIELYVRNESEENIIKTHGNFYVGLKIKDGKNNTKELLTSGSCEGDRYIIKSVMVEGNSFTSFGEVKKQFNINGQPKSIENTFQYPAKDLAGLLEVSKKEAQDNAAQLEEKNAKITELEAAEEQLKRKNEELEAAKKEAEEKLKQELEKEKEELKAKTQDLQAKLTGAENKQQELQTQLDTAQQEKQDLEAEVEKLKAIDSTALQQQLEEKNAKITELEALDAVALQQKLTEEENEITALKAQPDAAVTKLEGEKTTLTNKIKDLEAQLNNQPNAAQLKDKDEKTKDLEAQLSNRPDAAQLKDKVESLKKDLKDKNDRVHQLEKENKELEAKNKTTEQPKQGNGARYTATVGMGLAAGLIAFTALERTVRLDIWVMVGIAVVSTLAVGSITYTALPSTQVNGAEVQGVSGRKTR